jgi:hypothetical protein
MRLVSCKHGFVLFISFVLHRAMFLDAGKGTPIKCDPRFVKSFRLSKRCPRSSALTCQPRSLPMRLVCFRDVALRLTSCSPMYCGRYVREAPCDCGQWHPWPTDSSSTPPRWPRS